MFGIITKVKNKLFRRYLLLRGAAVGKGSSISYTTELINPQNATIGGKSTIYKNVSVYIGRKGSFTMGDFSHIAPFSYFLVDNNKMVMGNHVAIAPYSAFFCHSNYYSEDKALYTHNYIDGDIYIGSNVFIGAHCVVLPNTIIEDNVIVGANSVVRGKLERGYLYAGNPVKKIKKISE